MEKTKIDVGITLPARIVEEVSHLAKVLRMDISEFVHTLLVRELDKTKIPTMVKLSGEDFVRITRITRGAESPESWALRALRYLIELEERGMEMVVGSEGKAA